MNRQMIKTVAQSASLGLLLMMCTGCMVSPNHGEYVDSFVSRLHPAGFMDKPNAAVQFQAYDWDNFRWVTVATTTSRSTSMRWDGRDWYYWQTGPVAIAQERFWRCHGFEGGKAKLRAMSGGNHLYTFEDWNWSYDKTLGNVGDYGPLEMEVFTYNGPFKCWEQ